MTDRASFEAFVAARTPSLLRTAYLLTQDHRLAEDLVQTVFGKCWTAWTRLYADNPGGYAHRVLVNTYLKWWRRRWNAERPTEELPATTSADEDTAVAERLDLRRALRRLPKRQRAVVILRYYEDLSEADTAELLGCSIGTVKSQASKGLAKLRVDPELADTYTSRTEPT